LLKTLGFSPALTVSADGQKFLEPSVIWTSGPLAASQRISFHRIVKNCNHKRLGIYYLLSAFIFGISGTLISVLIRIELYSSGNRIISPENQNFYNISGYRK